MHEVEQTFRRLVQSVTDYAIFMLDLEGRVVSWNTGAEKIKGYSASEIVGKHFSAFYTEDDRRAGKPAMVLAEARRHGRFAEEGWRVRKGGSRFWASVVVDTVYDEGGAHVGYAKVTRDMTEQQKLRAQMFHAQKMEAIGNLTSGIAHDFNNLLCAVQGSLDMIARNADGNDKVVRYLSIARRSVDRASGLVHHLLTFARRQPLRVERVDVATQLGEAVAVLARTLPASIAVTADLAPDLAPVDMDPREFELAILNVGTNARDAMPRGGTLRVAASNASPSESLPEGLSGEFVKVSVSDSGEGIPAEVLDKVVEPYFTTKPLGKGSGLGLSQAYGFAEQSGGRLVIKSQVGAGTDLTFYLPASSRAPPPASLTPRC